jgi:hypothetical protein
MPTINDRERQPVTTEWLESIGFKREPIVGFVRHLSDGPGRTRLRLLIGLFPFNSPAVTLYVGDFGVGTHALTRDEIAMLVRLFDGAPIDHPYEA